MRFSELIEDNTSKDDGLYVAAHFHHDTIAALKELQDKLEIPNNHNPSGLHCTIVYSRKTIPWECQEHLEDVVARPTGWEIFSSQSGKSVLVMLVESSFLRERFDYAMSQGATYDFDEYRPHISFSYDVGPDFDHRTLTIPDLDILITHEVKGKVID